jgi:hypothetical protein
VGRITEVKPSVDDFTWVTISFFGVKVDRSSFEFAHEGVFSLDCIEAVSANVNLSCFIFFESFV